MQTIPEADIMEPDSALGELVRDMKEADPSFRAPSRKRQSSASIKARFEIALKSDRQSTVKAKSE